MNANALVNLSLDKLTVRLRHWARDRERVINGDVCPLFRRYATRTLETRVAFGALAGDIVPGIFDFVCWPDERLNVGVGCCKSGAVRREAPPGSLTSAGVGFHRCHFEDWSAGLWCKYDPPRRERACQSRGRQEDDARGYAQQGSSRDEAASAFQQILNPLDGREPLPKIPEASFEPGASLPRNRRS
jgi:hypothetical protein